MSDEPKRSGWKRWLLRLCLAFVVLVAAGYFARNVLLRKGVESSVTRATGFPLEIGGFDLGLFNTRIEVDDLRLLNPEGFEDRRCLRVPRLVADVDLRSAFGPELHIREIVLDVAEVVVVRNAKGETNLDRLRALGGEKAPAEEKKPAGPEKPVKWRCDRLEIGVGKALLLDYSRMKDGKPKEESFDIGVHEEFRNVTSPEQIVKIITWKVLSGSPVRLMHATIDSIKEGLGGVMNSAGEVLGSAAGAAGDAVKGVGDALGGILGGDKKKEPPKKKR